MKKLISITLAVAMIFALCISSYALATPDTETTVHTNSEFGYSYTKSVEPNGEYCVEFVERSTGASGGETMVRIYEKSFDVYVFSFREKPEILYTGA